MLTASAPPSIEDSTFDTDPTIIGGERDIVLTVEQGLAGLVFTAGAAGGTFTVSTPNDGSGFVLLQYDGADSSEELDFQNGLGGLDLTAGNAIGLRIDALSDVPTEFTISIYDASGSSVQSQSQVNGGSRSQSYQLLFSDFDGSVDFTRVTAIEFLIEAFDNVDFNLQQFVTFSNFVPPVVSDCFNGTASPCLTNYYRLEELTDIQPGDYITVDYFPTAEPGAPTSTATFYLLASNFEDLQNELTLNTNIISTLGELPGSSHYDYKCHSACEIEVVWSQLQNTTYYIAIEGSGPGVVDYNICISKASTNITQLEDHVPLIVRNATRPTEPPADAVLDYAYFSIDIPTANYSEGTYLIVNISRVQPTGSYILSLMHESLPIRPEDTGLIGAIDVNSHGNRVDDTIYHWCVDTSVEEGDYEFTHPVNFQPRIPCQCTTFSQRIVPGFSQQTCQLTVDPCHFKYGTWYASVLLPARLAPEDPLDTSGYTDFTIEASIIQPDIFTLPHNATISHAVEPEQLTHYRINIPENEYSPGNTHLIVRIANVRNGFVNVYVHQGQGVGKNLAGGLESCTPANATCRTCDACNVVVEKCHFSSGPWYISVGISWDEETQEFEIWDWDRLPITYTLEVEYVRDPAPIQLVAGVPVMGSVGEALYDFYVLDVPPTIDTFLYIQLYAKANDTEVQVGVLHGELPGGDCYARPDFYCLTGDPRGIRSSYGPTSFIDNEPIQRESCNFMIQACELTPGPLYFSVYGHHKGYIPYGDATFYQIPVDYTLYVEFDTPLALSSGVSYSEVVYQDEYQHYYIRADRIFEGQWMSVEITNIQNGIPQTIEGYVNHNYLAGDCPCYDSMFTCTQDSQCTPDTYDSPFAYPDIETVNTCCTILVHPSDFNQGVWYVSVRGVNEDQFQYTTPIGYTLTVTIHDPPHFTFLPIGQEYNGVAPRWNRTHEYSHFRLAAKAVPLNDLVIKLTWVQTCSSFEERGHLSNMWESLSLFVNYKRTAGKNPTGHRYECTASDVDDSFCTVVIPHCEWLDEEYLLAVRGDYEADFPARFTLHARAEPIRDVQLHDGIPYYGRVEQGLYKHHYIETDAEEDTYLAIDVYTNQDQDPVTVYLNHDTRAGDSPCFDHHAVCHTQSACSWQLKACELTPGRYYISVQGAEHQFYYTSTEYTIIAAHLPVHTKLINNFPVTGHLQSEGQYIHYSYEIDQLVPGAALEFSVDAVKHGSVHAFVQHGSLAGRCPCFTWEDACSASSEGQEWCTIRIAPCELQIGTYFFSVWAESLLSPDPPVFTTPIGFTAQVQVITPTFADIETDVGRQTEDTLFEELGIDRYRHYAISWDDDDFANGYHLIVEITNVRNGNLDVYYNAVDPADESCNMAQICNNGIGPGADCYWQLPYCLTRPLDDPINHYISVYNRNPGARQNAEYNILIWKQPVPVVTEDRFFTLDGRISSRTFPRGSEYNVTHSVFNEPNGWTQFFRLQNVDLTLDEVAYGEVLELFFYRITNNFGEPMSFNVYAHPNEPAGAHECCHKDPGSCQGAPCSNTADTTTLTNGQERITHTCVLPDGVGHNDQGSPFFGQRCTVQVWPCEFGKYCADTVKDWFVSVVPIAPVSLESSGPGLQYSFQWRVRNLRYQDNSSAVVGTVDLTEYINTYNFTDAFEVVSAPNQENQGWRSFAIDWELENSRLSIQTLFLEGEGTVYINRDGFASAGGCYDYECTSIQDCEGSERFITSECCSNIPNRGYFITIRNTGLPNSVVRVAFRITSLTLPDVIFIDDHPTIEEPFIAESTVSPLPNFIFGVQNENYDFYSLTIDDDDLDRDQSWIVQVEHTGNSTQNLHVFIRFGATPGAYGPSVDQVAYGSADEGCHGWDYFCDLEFESTCLWQIPHCQLIEGHWYIGIQNPASNLNGLPDELPNYRLTTYISEEPTPIELGIPVNGRMDTNATNLQPIGTLLHYTLNLTTTSGGFDDRNDIESYWARHLRFQVTNITAGSIEMWINYDDLAGPSSQTCLGSFTKQTCEVDLGCYYDVVPCEIEGDQFKLKTGVYFISLRLSEPADYELVAEILAEPYELLAPAIVEEGVSQRINTINTVWIVSSNDTRLSDNGDGEGNYRYVIDISDAESDDDDMPDNQYMLVNITAPALGVSNNQTLHLDVWRDDCTRWECDLSGPLSWCTIDALTLGPCALKGGRFYFRVENPLQMPFELVVYLNETIMVPILDRQVITEIINPYEYQEYFYDSTDVGDGATLTVRVCSICGDVEAWIRPDLPAGPTPDVSGNPSSCSIDHCETVSGPDRSAFGEFPRNCCEMFLDTCEYEQRGYYVGVRGVTTLYPNQANQNAYLPATYNIEIYQTTVNFTDISYAQCPKTINYYEPVDNVPRQYAVDIETVNVGSIVRFSLHVENGPEVVEGFESTLSVSLNRSLGYSEQCPTEFMCSSATECDVIVPYCALVSNGPTRIYIRADAPRGSEILVERYDPIVPVVHTDVVYHSTVNGPTTGEVWDLPYRPNVQLYRFDVPEPSEDERFFVRVIVSGVVRGTLSASVNSGHYPYMDDTGCQTPVFVDSSSCSEVSDGDVCWIDIQWNDVIPTNQWINAPRTFWLTIHGLEQSCERNSIQYSFVVQSHFAVTYFPVGGVVCDEVAPHDYNFHRLRHPNERPQETILRLSVEDLDVDENVTLLINDGRLATIDGSDVSITGAHGSAIIEDFYCGYDELYVSVYGGDSSDGSIDYKLSIEKHDIRIKELFNDSVYHADDDDDDACPHEHDFYMFQIPFDHRSPEGTFFRVAVDSEFETEVYVNRGSVAWKNCHNAAAGSNNPRLSGTTTVNVYDFCDFRDANYYITVVSDGPYYIYTDLRDDPKNLTLGQVFRDELEPGMYQMYTLEICEDWFEADDRLVVEITDVEHGDVYGWIRRDGNPGPYNHDDGSGDCSSDSAFANYGGDESGYDFLLVNSCELSPGIYHILIRASPHEGSPERNCQHVEYRLFPYLIDYQIEPDVIFPNSVIYDVVDYYTINRIDDLSAEFINYYTLTPYQDEDGFIEQISHMVVRLAAVDGGLLRLRVMCGHLALAEYGYFDGEIYGLTKEDLIDPVRRMQSGRRPFTYQRMLDDTNSIYQPECDGCTDFCCEMTYDDIDEYTTDKSCAIWIPSCYLTWNNIYIAVEPVHQYAEDHSIYYDLAVTQSHDYVKLETNTQFVSSFSEDNWDYDFVFSLTPEAESMRWRFVVTEGEGILVSVRNHRCPLQSSWNKQIWCDAAYFDRPWMCDIEIPTRAEHPGTNAFFISIYGKNATYSLGYWSGRENCHLFSGSGRNEGLDFCAGLVPYATWRWDSYLNLDNEARCFFEELYEHFQVQPCFTGVSAECNSTLAAFACYESFHGCDEQGFATPTCRQSCNSVVSECYNTFDLVDLEHYNCTSSRYGDGHSQTCTMAPFALEEAFVEEFEMAHPDILDFRPSPNIASSASKISFNAFVAVFVSILIVVLL